MKNKLKQAYKQKPWRIQLQWVGRILLILIIAIVALVFHLELTTQAAEAGTEIRNLEAERESLIRDIHHNHTTVAMLTSTSVMQERAEAMGFRPASQAEIEYLFLDEYINKEPEIFLQKSTLNFTPAEQIKPPYLQSIWDLAFSGTIFYLERGGK